MGTKLASEFNEGDRGVARFDVFAHEATSRIFRRMGFVPIRDYGGGVTPVVEVFELEVHCTGTLDSGYRCFDAVGVKRPIEWQCTPDTGGFMIVC